MPKNLVTEVSLILFMHILNKNNFYHNTRIAYGIHLLRIIHVLRKIQLKYSLAPDYVLQCTLPAADDISYSLLFGSYSTAYVIIGIRFTWISITLLQ